MRKYCCVMGLTLLLTGCNLASTMYTVGLVQKSDSAQLVQRRNNHEDLTIASTNIPSDIVKPLEHEYTEKFWTLQDVDLFNLIPIADLSTEEQVVIRAFINDTMKDNLYTDCVAIEFVVDEELNGHCYHFVFNENRYMCIYYEEGHSKPLLLYDKILDERLIEKWDYI